MAKKGDVGSGVGKGGGAGGAIREAGGKMGEKQASNENSYFKKEEASQLEALRKLHAEEIEYHQGEIKVIKGIIKRHRHMKSQLGHQSTNK